MTPGSLIAGKYRLLRLVGKGAMGVVWAAVNERTEREVALKLINSQNEELRRRLLREARACGRLDHRNIIEIYDVGENDAGDPFLVMPLLTGETLADRLDRDGLLVPSMAARIAADIASGLSAAHLAGIVHRDLKPANVFLHREAGGDEAFVVKVLDFGVSKMVSGAEAGGTLAGGAIGSPLYMSPEQARGDRNVDHRADLWATGVVLFEMLTGTRPFHGDTMFTVVAQILAGPIPSVGERAPHVDRALADVVARCLERQPAQRVGSAAELAALLLPFAGTREHTVPSARLVARRPPPSEDDGPTELFKKPANLDALATDLLDRRPLAGTVLVPEEPAPAGEPSEPSSPSLTSTTPLIQPAEAAPRAEASAAPAAPPRRAMRWLGVALAIVSIVAIWGIIYQRLTRPPSAPPTQAMERAVLSAAVVIPALDQPPTPTATPTPSATTETSAAAVGSTAPVPSASTALVPERAKAAPPAAGRTAAPAASSPVRAREIIRETPF